MRQRWPKGHSAQSGSVIGQAALTLTIRRVPFSHCAAGANYLSNVSMIISLNLSDQWNIGFASPSFNLNTGETFPIEVTFDGQSKLRLFGTALAPQAVGAMLPSNALLRKSHIMIAEAKGATFQFQLKDIDRVVSAVASCAAKTKLSGVAAAGDFSAPRPNQRPLPQSRDRVRANRQRHRKSRQN